MSTTVTKVLTKIFGSRNDRLLKRYRAVVAEINAMEPKIQEMTDEQLRARTQELRSGLTGGTLRSSDVLPEAFAIIRESMDRNIGIRQIFNLEEDPDNKFDPDKFDDEALEMYDEVQRRMIALGESWQRVSIPPKLYQAVRKIYPESRPPYRARCFDVQLIGGVVLYEGKIAEMATGEGKTFVAPLACFLRALEGNHCHVVTVNDYLVRRDSLWVKPAFEALGISVGYIQSDMDPGGDSRREMYACDITYGTNSEFGFDFLRDNMKVSAAEQVQGSLDYAIVDEVDSILIDEARTPLIISGPAHDDPQKYRAADAVARKVLELNKPWTDLEKRIDGAKRAIKAAEGDMDKHKGNKGEVEAARQRMESAQKQLEELEGQKTGLTQYYEVELDRKSVHLTHEGITAAQDAAGVGSFYVGNNMEWPHLMEQALRAHVVYERDKDYVVEKGTGPRATGELEVVIVDEYTGRKMVGRQWSDGLHQAVEAKERVPIKQESQTLATVTLQNFFKLYKQLSGMTGTAMTEAEEFTKIYKLEVVSIPTNRPVIRADNEDRVYRSAREKWESILEEIKLQSDAGRPVLVGTTSVEKSEMLSTLLKRKYGIKHEVLNAKQHEREANIVAVAGHTHENAHGERVGNVTIATNMAGRGTDIKLAADALWDVTNVTEISKGKEGTIYNYVLTQRGTGKKFEVRTDDARAEAYQLTPEAKIVGGLHVIGTERHTARRIDNQLRGRGGRQGDPGSSRFYVSLEDELMQMFAGEWTIKVLGWLGMEEGMAIEDKRISKGILNAQKKVEERNFLARKNLLEYDEVMDYQRTTFYGMRQRVLEGRDVDQLIWEMIGDSTEDAVRKYIEEDYVSSVIAEWTRMNFDINIDAAEFKGLRDMLDLENFIKNQAKTEVEHTINATLGEFMGEDREQREWDTRGLASWAMQRFQVNLSQTQLRKMSPDEVEEYLKEVAVAKIDERDVAGVAKYLEPLYAEGELASWAQEKFGITVDPKEMIADPGRRIRKPVKEIAGLIEARAREAYKRREVEYPVDHVLTYVYQGEEGVVDDPYRADWMRNFVKAKYDEEMALEDLMKTPVRQLRDRLIGYQEGYLLDGGVEKAVDALLAEHMEPSGIAKAMNERFMTSLTASDLDGSNRKQEEGSGEEEALPPFDLRAELMGHARRFFRRELSDLEAYVLIQIFDTTWKDHLYAMDVLRATIGLQAFAEKDPRIQYKKQGYAFFEEMLEGMRDKVTDLIFRARLGGQAPRKSAYQEAEAVHADAGGYGVGENIAATSAMLGEGAAAAQGGEGEAQGGGAPAVVKPIVNEAPKVGRNDPCPCGSGKKYKKCCGVNAA